jgi:hypothetical protein
METTVEKASIEFAHNYFEMHETNNYKALKQGFKEGAEWQSKKMYSESDMTNYALYILHNDVITPQEWLKIFKK